MTSPCGSPMYSLMLGTKIMIVLSSDHAIKDLLDKRSAIYSSRPEMYLGQTIASRSLRIAFMVRFFALSFLRPDVLG